ncbi:MAG: hypothetical protein NAG76_22620 [Candidatus Pristimantibacillus lignocellulolyticus]|uniref:DUF4231 domain-containing protein n=1 Tax=Candidatus Pristimantibacillus lignocellulolyticus TaxID=2994561 RepID=A0A9J6ZEJ4_9BACL|nr:MAG: hypothetical protein NAG76_22620 [Candidatus Pristimantibacillus lignocellulolyticus]
MDLVNQMEVLRTIVGASLEMNKKKMDYFKKRGFFLRGSTIVLSSLVTIFAGFGLSGIALVASAILTASIAFDSLLKYSTLYRLYYRNLTRLSVLDVKINMSLASQWYSEDLYEEWFNEYNDIQKDFHENRINIMKESENHQAFSTK